MSLPGNHIETMAKVLALRVYPVPVKPGGRTNQEIADMVGLTRTCVDDIYKRALAKIRAKAVEEMGFKVIGRVK